jgi:uncharacterized membrane protein YkoI
MFHIKSETQKWKLKMTVFPAIVSFILVIAFFLSNLSITSALPQRLADQHFLYQSVQNTNATSAVNWTGSVQLLPLLTNAIKSQLTISINEAISTAQNAVGTNSSVFLATVSIEKGFLVYSIFVIDQNNSIHKILIDTASGEILSIEQISTENMSNYTTIEPTIPPLVFTPTIPLPPLVFAPSIPLPPLVLIPTIPIPPLVH